MLCTPVSDDDHQGTGSTAGHMLVVTVLQVRVLNTSRSLAIWMIQCDSSQFAELFAMWPDGSVLGLKQTFK